MYLTVLIYFALSEIKPTERDKKYRPYPSYIRLKTSFEKRSEQIVDIFTKSIYSRYRRYSIIVRI